MLSSMYANNLENIDANRKRQIDTLKAFNEKVSVIEEDVEYRIEFTTNIGAMCLTVQLPKDFPTSKPNITVHPPVLHAWVTNERQVTQAPGILNFTPHSDLGRVTNAIIREWQARPPQLIPTQGKLSDKIEPVPPLTSEEFPALGSLPTPTLQSITSNTDRLEEFVATLPHWRSWDNAVRAKIAEIEEIARDNLSKEADLDDIRQQVSEKASEAQAVKAGCEEKVRELARLSEAYEPENIRSALQDAAHETDLAAENIAERFLAGDIDVDQFLSDFVEMRKVCQIRKTKEEKLGKQLRELDRAGF